MPSWTSIKGPFIHRYGAPVLEDSQRPGTSPPVIDSVWEPGGYLRSVELTLDYVPGANGTPNPFFYIRTVGPDFRRP